MLKMLIAKNTLTNLIWFILWMEEEDTDTYCDSSEFKVSLYTGGESWGQV